MTTAVLVQTPSTSVVTQTSLSEAISDGTKDAITRHVAALRNETSPASLQLEHSARADENTLQERLFDALAGAKVLTAQVAMHLDRQWRDKLFRQLDSLHDPDEW